MVRDPIVAAPEEAIDEPIRPVGRRRKRGRPRGRSMAPRAHELDKNLPSRGREAGGDA